MIYVADFENSNQSQSYLCGNAPKGDLACPRSPDNIELLHICSLNRNDLPINLFKEEWMVVFSDVAEDQFSHIENITAFDNESLLKAVQYTKVYFLDDSGFELCSRTDANEAVNFSLRAGSSKNEEDLASTYISGTPHWLQSPLKLEGYEFLMQLSYADFDDFVPKAYGIFRGGFGYIFRKNNSSEGILFFQVT